MSPEKEPRTVGVRKLSRRRQRKDPGLILQNYLAGANTPEEALFKINELLNAGQIENTRRYPRAPLTLPVIFKTGAKTSAGSSYTLSQRGMFIKCTDPPPTGSLLEVDLSLPQGELIRIAAEVLQSNPLKQAAKSSSLSGMSVVFRKISAEDRRKIDRLVRAQARRMRKVIR